MHNPVVIIGLGEMGGVFARGLLSLGYPVFPVTRHTDLIQLAQQLPAPQMVLVAVGEADLHTTLDRVPAVWRDRLALLQNELLPRDWLQHQLDNPTVISVWFEKKKGQDHKVIIASPAYGPHAGLLHDALACLDIPVHVLDSEARLLFELVRKNVYILTSNIAGLVVGGSVAELWRDHQALARAVANDVIDIQQWLTWQTFEREQLIAGMVDAFEGDPEHRCMGRSAPARLARALTLADQAGLTVSTLRQIKA